MYCKKFYFFVLFVIALMASSCKKDSLSSDDDLGNNNTPANIPSPLDIDPVHADSVNKYIVVIGSSTAAGFGASVRDSCWTGRLRNKLIVDKKKFKLINFGVGGYTTFHLMPSSTAAMSIAAQRPLPDTNKNVTAALKYHPVLVIINLPSNDIAANFRDEEIIRNYRLMVRTIASANCDYIITGSQPRNFPSPQQRMRLKILNDKLTTEFPNHIDDYLKKISTASWAINRIYGAGDGIHLNNLGHKVIYQSIFEFPIFKKVADYN